MSHEICMKMKSPDGMILSPEGLLSSPEGCRKDGLEGCESVLYMKGDPALFYFN